MNNDTNLPFYLAAINGKDGFYETYIVNTTNKEYFLRTRYEEKILKAKSALFYGQIIKDRDHESISPWICDDKSETYLLYFSNLPYYCQSKTYDEYLKRDDVFKLTCKIENIFHQLKTVKIRNKNKDLQLDKLDSFVYDEIHKIKPNIKALIECLNNYLKTYQSYHSFGKLKLLFSYFETLCTINDFLQISEFDIITSIKEAINHNEFLYRLKINEREEFVNHFLENLAFLELSTDDKKQMKLDVQIYDSYNDIFLAYLKNSSFDLEEETEVRLDRFNCSKHYKITKDIYSLEFDSIYSYVDDGVVYYFTLSISVFQKVLLDFIQNNSKFMFDIKYIQDNKESSFEIEYDRCKNSWY